jgi:hypothetical protein
VVSGDVLYESTNQLGPALWWGFGKNRTDPPEPSGAGGDPTHGCPPRDETCNRIDLTVRTNWYQLEGGGRPSGSPIPTNATVTYTVEARAYFLDATEVPRGAGLGLGLSG